MDNQLITTNNLNPVEQMRLSTDVAGACKEIVSRTAQKIQGRKYVRVEGWMAIATAHGCTLSACDVKQIEGGISARGLVRRISDGVLLGEAEGFVGDDEKTWSVRTLHARRAMAQTRAMSRAARSVFAHVVVLMDAGLETTPAEEMDSLHEEKDVTPPPEKPKKIEPVKVTKSIEDKFMEKVLFCYTSDDRIKAYGMLDSARKLMDMVENGEKVDMDQIKSYFKNLFTDPYKTGKYKHGITLLQSFCEIIGLKEEEEKFAWWYAYNNGAGGGD